jgi:tetratricopeptide (TPR) repeat protein
MAWRQLVAGFAVALLVGAHLHGIYIVPELLDVPVERLVENLEQISKDTPRDVQSRLNIARLHAMAFALKTDTAKVWKGREALGPFFGFDPAHVPFKSVPTSDAAVLATANAHLAKAIERYREVIALDPANLTAKLGYAWCLEQSGQKDAAVRAYRQLIGDAWLSEQKLTGAGPSWHSVTVEAAGYLVPLLDQNTDREEIASLRARTAQIARIPRPITPIAVPLRDGADPAAFLDHDANVWFDADGSGLKKHWSWIGADAGWLVHAPNPHKPVASALQLFGSVTFWLFWDNGYQAMRALDDDGDGSLTGRELAGLAIWRDGNKSGVAEAGEVKPLNEWGVVSLSCAYQDGPADSDTVAFSPAGVTFMDGTTRPTYDVILYSRVDGERR